MKQEDIIKRSQDEYVKYIKEHMYDKDGDKPFVFVSYKSDDWYVVLHDIVYSLVKNYGLHVYFDGSFDLHNSLWINQFNKNMEDAKCVGVLAFIDNKYTTSYATLLELMYSQRYVAADVIPDASRKINVNGEGLPVILVNLEKLTSPEYESGALPAGLGEKYYTDGSININAKQELDVFDETFEELKQRGIFERVQYKYKRDKPLTRSLCSDIAHELLSALNVNENRYLPGVSLDGIVASIKDACGEGVFDDSISHNGNAANEEISSPLITGSANNDIEQKTVAMKFEENNLTKDAVPSPPAQSEQKINNNIYAGLQLAERLNLSGSMNLKEFAEKCKSPEFCLRLRWIREVNKDKFDKQFFDFLIAVILRGCDQKLEPGSAGWNYCVYAVSKNVNLASPELGASQYTWQSNSRKAVNIPKSGKLGERSEYFRQLDEKLELWQIRDFFADAQPDNPYFYTKNNGKIIMALEMLAVFN